VRALKNSPIVSRLHRGEIFRISCWRNISFSGKISRASFIELVDFAIIYELSWTGLLRDGIQRDRKQYRNSDIGIEIKLRCPATCRTLHYLHVPSLQLLLQNDKAQNLHASTRTWSRHLHKCQQVAWKCNAWILEWYHKKIEREKKIKVNRRF